MDPHGGGTETVLVMGLMLLLVMLILGVMGMGVMKLLGVVGLVVVKMMEVAIRIEAMRMVETDLLLMGLVLTPPTPLMWKMM